ncbi:MAG: hypothetical protein WAV04_00350 [Candidatus Microsaccharimonas sp.]
MELARSTSRGGLSVRSVFTFALAAIFAAILWVTFASPATHAADASWSGSAILYEGNKYLATNDKEILKDVGLESASKVYVFVDPAQADGNPSSSNGTSPPTARKIRLIYFDANTDSSTATEATYKDLTYVGQGNYTNPSAIKPITFSQTGAEGTTSCDVDTGLGWIICPVTTTLATAMDAIYDILTGFLEVRPVETGQDNALYRAWKIMQGFANIAFVIVFLIIIYSQLTGAGISSYGLKKLLPRLIIAALLVNLSYFISSIAIDISNILGYSLQDIFISMRNSLVGTEGNSWDEAGITSWESLAEFGLSGGTLLAAGGTAAFIAVADFGPTVIFLILPALVVALIAVLVALVVLAARQAIIIILVILSPLAFVAYLLPNTEKWFGKWRDTFFTMLFLFPAFSVVFGGSQLAATAIIQTADSINLVILGMLVQVAPLFITPLLIKLGGGLLGRIAGLVNDPNKGIIDRTRKFAEDRTQNARARRIADPKGWQLMRRNARWRYDRQKDREQWRAKHTERADANWAGRPRATRIDNYGRESGDIKTLAETNSETRYNNAKLVQNSRLQLLDVDLQNAKGTLANAHHDVELQYKNLKSRDTGNGFNIIPAHLASRAMIARHNAQHSSAITRAIHEAENMQQQEYAKDLQQSEALRRFAGGINPHGADSALAAAINTVREAYGKSVTEARAINKHFELSSGERQRHGRGETIRKIKDGAVRIFTPESTFTREAAIEDQITTGTVEEVEEFVRLSGTPEFADFRSTIAETLAKNGGMTAKALHMGGQSIDDIAQGRVVGEEGLDWITARAIAKGKLSEKDVAGLDAKAVERFRAIVTSNRGRANLSATERAIMDQRIGELSKVVREAMTGDEKTNIKPSAVDDLLAIARLTDENFDPDA